MRSVHALRGSALTGFQSPVSGVLFSILIYRQSAKAKSRSDSPRAAGPHGRGNPGHHHILLLTPPPAAALTTIGGHLSWLGIALAAIIVALRTRAQLRELEARERQRDQAFSAVEQRLQDLQRVLVALAGPLATEPHAAEPVPRKSTSPLPASPSLTPAVAPASVPAAPMLPAAPVVPAPPVIPGLKPSPPIVAGKLVPPPVIGAAAPATRAVTVAPAMTAEHAPQAAPPAGLPPPPPPSLLPPIRIDWENLIGVKLFSGIAGVALVFAAIFFLRYSVERGWLGPPVRMAIGLVVGSGLLAGCELGAARRYPVTANALDAAGIAILFATLFASHALWNLLPQAPVFLLMSLVTAVAVLLSIRRDSLFIALLGLVGGFATPALLSTGEDRPIGLFSYLLLLNGGLVWVAYRKRWLLLTALSVTFTAFYQWAWVLKFLDASRLPLAMSIFAIFPVLHLVSLILVQRRRPTEPLAAEFDHVALAGAVLPILFALYMTTIPAYGTHYVALFTFLLLMTGGLTAIAVLRGPQLLYPFAAVSTVLAFAVWFAVSYGHAAWPGILGVLVVFVLFHLAVPLVARWWGRALDALPALADAAAPLLLFAFAVLAAIEPATSAPGLLFSVLIGLAAVIAAVAVAGESGRLHFLAAFFVLVAEAVWSSHHLTPEHLLAALTLYATFALFYLGVPLLAERLGKRLEPQGSGAIVLFVSLALLLFLATGPVASAALWGLALLLVMLNAGLLLEAAHGRLPFLSVAGAVLSWIVIAVWWSTAMVAALLIPSLLVVGGFALLLLAGNVWAGQQAAAAHAGGALRWLQRGPALGLIGHVFLLFVASQPSLALPPWPWFAVLALLNLGFGAAALYQRDATFFLAASVASPFILASWILVSQVPPWPLVGIAATLVVAVTTLLWIPLARRRGAVLDGFAQTAALTALLGQCVVVVASQQPGPPLTVWVALAHIALLTGLFAVGTHSWVQVAVWAVVPTGLQSLLWVFGHHLTAATWATQLLFHAALYLPFLLYPLWLGARAGRARSPYLAAVLMSGVFFLVARECMVVGGLAGALGVLPVAQAVCLLVLLVRLLQVEPPDNRHQGRLALVAGAALAFITVAIPLQLDREWITIGWALEGAALAWLYRRIPHRGVLAWASGLCLVVFVRLCVNPAVFTYHARGAAAVFNWYLYTYLVSAAALFQAARWLRGTDDDIGAAFGLSERLRSSNAFIGGAALILFLLLNIEIADFYSTGRTLTFDFSAGLAQDLTYTLGWALFAIGLLAAGINRGSRAARIASLTLLVVTIVKCFLHDLWRLGGLYSRRLLRWTGDLPGAGGRAAAALRARRATGGDELVKQSAASSEIRSSREGDVRCAGMPTCVGSPPRPTPPALRWGRSINGEQALRDGPEKMGPPQGERKCSLKSITQPFALRSRLLLAASRRAPAGEGRRSRWAGGPIALLLVLLGVLVTAPAHAELSGFRRERLVTPGSAGPNRLAVDAPLLAGAQPLRDRSDRTFAGGLDDLRFFDPSGHEVAYLLMPPPPSTEQWQAAHALPIAATDETSGFDIDLGQPLRIDRLRMNGIPAPFLKRLRLEGSGDREHWTMLVSDGTVFDLPDESLRRTTLDFTAGELQYLRVTWDDRNSAVVAAPRAVEAHLAGAAAPPPLESVEVRFERRASEPGKSRFRVHLSGSHLPIVALELSCGGGHLQRTAQVTEPRLTGSQVVPVPLGSHTLQRAVRNDLVAADLRIPISRPDGAELDLVVDDENNPPLELLAVRAQLAPLPWIYFESTGGESLAARFGDPTLAAPHYDLEAMRNAVGRVPLAEPLAEARWGEVRDIEPAAVTPAAADAMPGVGAAIDPHTFQYVRTIPTGAPGLAAVVVDAAMLAHSHELRDVRIVDASGHQVPYVVEQLGEPLAIELATPQPLAATVKVPPHQSRYGIALPFESLPPGRLVLSTPARIFERQVTLAVERPPADARSEARLERIASRSWRHANPEQPAPELVVPLPALAVSTVQLWIDEGDNSPLPLARPQLLLPGYRLRFFRHTPEALSLLYGETQLEAPRYDLALLAPQVLGAASTEVVALDEHSSTPPPAEHGTVTQQRLFWAALIAAVLVLLGVTARLLLPGERPKAGGA